MENNDKDLQVNKRDSLTTRKQNEVSFNLKEITSFEQAETLANYVAESSVFNTNFKKQIENEDGKVDYIVDKPAIVTCLLLGAELGFSPMMSITFGKRLNREAAIKCSRGRDMGLSPTASMEHIYVFNAGSREIVYTGIHVVNKVLTDNGIKRNIIEDGTKPYIYYTYINGVLKGEEAEYDGNIHVITNNGIKPADLKSALEDGKIPVQMHISRRAIVELSRGDEKIAIPYTLQQAIDAGLHKGIKSDGTESKGKDNWNNHPATHLVKMSIMLGGRIIASDKLNGIYEESELTIIKQDLNSKATDIEFSEAEEVE